VHKIRIGHQQEKHACCSATKRVAEFYLIHKVGLEMMLLYIKNKPLRRCGYNRIGSVGLNSQFAV
jgi:hypothetical protein